MFGSLEAYRQVELKSHPGTVFPTALAELYFDVPTQIYVDTDPIGDSRINKNQFDARDGILELIQQGNRGIMCLWAPMGAGKSTTLALVYEYLGSQAQMFKHALDRHRFSQTANASGEVEIITQGHDSGLHTGIFAREYTTISDLLGQIDLAGSKMVIADEIQFAGLDGEGKGKPIINYREIDQLQLFLEENRMTLITAGLDFDYASRPWPNTSILTKLAKLNLVLQARCEVEGCGGKAFQTYREVEMSNGLRRPALIDEDIVQVGRIGELNGSQSRYGPRCRVHYDVWTQAELNKLALGWEYLGAGFWFNPNNKK